MAAEDDLYSSGDGASRRRKGDPERSPFCHLALLCMPRHRPGPALTGGGTASSQAHDLAQPGPWAGLVEGLVRMTAGMGRSGDHVLWSLPGPFQPGGPTNMGEPFDASPSALMALGAASTARATLPTWVTSTL